MLDKIDELRKQLLEDPNVQTNINAANELGNMPEREKAIEILKEGFEIANHTLHIALINALVKHSAKEAIPNIAECLKSLNATERNAAIDALIHKNIQDTKVVKIFRERLRFERDNNAKILIIQRLSELPYEETVELLLELLKNEQYRVSPFLENIRSSLSSICSVSPEKIIKELGSPIGDEIVNILTSVNLSASPNIWDSIVGFLDTESAELYDKIRRIIVQQITKEFSEERIDKIISNILTSETLGVIKERSIEILDEISKTPHGPKLVKPTLQLIKERSEEEVKREKFLQELELKIANFDIARDYWKEVESSFVRGNFKAAIVMAISSLESCIKTDYLLNARKKDNRNEKEAEDYVWKTSLHDLLNRYFDREDIARLPDEYKSIMDTHRKIRNSLVHPKEFPFSEAIIKNNLTVVAELIKHLEGLHQK